MHITMQSNDEYRLILYYISVVVNMKSKNILLLNFIMNPLDGGVDENLSTF